LSAEAAPDARRSLAELQLRVVALLEPRQDELRGDALQTFEAGRAAALAATGKTDAARRAYDRLAKKYPRDGAIQQARAELMTRTNDPAALRAALAQWREIESKSRRGGERWFEARYAQAEAYFRLGEKEQAAKLVKLTQVLHPALGRPALKAQFERLLKRCQTEGRKAESGTRR
jgi:tetratricopeptide (TPR) repeat protein